MSHTYLANTYLELELGGRQWKSLRTAQESHPIFKQLQFLPLLYAPEYATVAVTEHADPDYLSRLAAVLKRPLARLCLLEDVAAGSELMTWGASPSVRKWAKSKNLRLPTLSNEALSLIHSKAFSFQHSPRLEGGALIHDLSELQSWMKHTRSPAVLKKVYGVSGRGHLLLDPAAPAALDRATPFLQTEWNQGRGIIAEPWKRRLLDFSSQWEISEEGEATLLGPCLLHNTGSGSYLGSTVASHEALLRQLGQHWDTHYATARTLLKQLASTGYTGPAGVDAFIYEEAGQTLCHPCAELNPRPTMSSVAWWLWQQMGAGGALRIDYGNEAAGLLPEALGGQRFRRQLTLQAAISEVSSL